MANKLVAVFLICLFVATAMDISQASAKPTPEQFKACYDSCYRECKTSGGQSFCEVKCDEECSAKEFAALLDVKYNPNL